MKKKSFLINKWIWMAREREREIEIEDDNQLKKMKMQLAIVWMSNRHEKNVWNEEKMSFGKWSCFKCILCCCSIQLFFPCFWCISMLEYFCVIDAIVATLCRSSIKISIIKSLTRFLIYIKLNSLQQAN